jgi:hypothetical protein
MIVLRRLLAPTLIAVAAILGSADPLLQAQGSVYAKAPADRDSSSAERGGTLPGAMPLFPPDNWWNQDISQAPIDPQSSQFINFINNGGTRRLHPDFGGYASPGSTDIYGFPYVVVAGNQPKRMVQFQYDDESDGVGFPAYPIPDEAITQPHWIEGGYPGASSAGGDRHMLIVDRDNLHLYELFDLRWNGSQWTAGSGAFFDLRSNQRRPEGWTSADAAGLAILPGLVRADEIIAPEEIRHAFRVTVRATNGYVWPASHRAGSNPSALPMGARLRLKASKDISSFHPGIQKVFRAFKRHGLIVADNGSDMYISGTFDPRWPNDILNPAFRSLTASDFEVIELGWRGTTGSCPLPGSAAPFSFSQVGPLVSMTWAAAAYAEEYVLEVGSAPGLANLLVASMGAGTSISAVGPPGRYYGRIRARNRCGAGPASNEIVVVI